MNEILGLPLHPLVVHAVVVLVPLVALGTVAAAVSRTWFDRLGVVLAVLAAGAAGAGFVARASGESLLRRVPGSPEVASHANVSDALPWLLVPAAALMIGWVLAGAAAPLAPGAGSGGCGRLAAGHRVDGAGRALRGGVGLGRSVSGGCIDRPRHAA